MKKIGFLSELKDAWTKESYSNISKKYQRIWRQSAFYDWLFCGEPKPILAGTDNVFFSFFHWGVLKEGFVYYFLEIFKVFKTKS